MLPAQINITLGTAGHIDHGKTALVKSLTGCETDRLKEEKERGMSIDLGFAPCMIADMQVGIVDVPGHENFIKTMVAGAAGMDGVILVVAADDGIMPQTREHLEILALLGVRHGVVALTKIDRVDAEYRRMVQDDLAVFLQGTFLEGAPILPVSNVTGEGFDRFLEGLLGMVKAIRPKRVDGVFRLPLDRAFSVQGYGTVVAGIPVAGSARVGDEVQLLPHGLSGRIRRIEVYGRPTDAVLAGQCAAVNVGHWEAQRIGRGHVIAAPGYFSAQEWYACALRLLPREKLLLKNGVEVKFHTGTAEVPAAVYSMTEGPMLAGNEYLVQVRTRTPIVAGPGDRFILRTLSPVRTAGGGMIVEALQRRLKRNQPDLCDDLRQRAAAVGDERRWVEYAARQAEGGAASADQLARRAKVPLARLQGILAELTRARTVVALDSSRYVHRDTLAALADRALAAVRQFHAQSPESPGMTPDQLRQATAMEKDVLDGAIEALRAAGKLVERNQRLAAAEHRTAFATQDAAHLEQIEGLLRHEAFHPPGPEQIAEKTGLPAATVQKILKILLEHQRVVKVEDLLFHREAVDRAREILSAHLRKEGRLESVDFKYLLDTTRKFALPLLDYFDRVGVTRRVGNTRYLKTPLAPHRHPPEAG